jgi:hypothetical protein
MMGWWLRDGKVLAGQPKGHGANLRDVVKSKR